MTALAIIIAVVSLWTLALWYVPVLLGYHSPYDVLFFVVWLVLVAFLVVLWFVKKNAAERSMRTAYLDFRRNMGFSQMGGAFQFASREDLMEQLVAQFTAKVPALAKAPELPEGFHPTAVVNTYKFLSRTGPQPQGFLVEQWQGDVQETLSDGTVRTHLFNSEMQLESVLDAL